METTAIVRRTSADIPSVNIKETEELIKTLLHRVRLLNNSLPACRFTSTETVKLVGVTVDKELLKSGEPEDYVGKGYMLVKKKKNRIYKPVYFKRADVVKLYTIE